MQEQHPFSRFVAILGRGKTKQRHLTLAEAREAMGMILGGAALREQIGAFLMLLRLKEEAPEEIAGFTLGARTHFDLPSERPKVDLDWSSYAGKRVQLPWFLLAALALADAGHKVFMHGTRGHTPGRVYTEDVLRDLGIPVSQSLVQAGEDIRARNFAYVPLRIISPKLQELIDLRPVFGLRTPVHSFSRMLNPFEAPVMMQGIFHRGFMDVHAGAAQLLEQPHMAVFRGEGGEIERRPNKPTTVWTTHGTAAPEVETWPALLTDGHQTPDGEMRVARLVQVWRGEDDNAYANAAIVGTLAVALRTMGQAATIKAAEAGALDLWRARNRALLPVKG